ncbi:MAG: anthranilate synthase component I family protein [Chitinophagaceae bacterium]|nr:anthranilate synthase component I family protein [Chitinophagaceae bacterium]
MNNTILAATFPVTDFGQIKNKVLNWIKRFSTFCFLDNHQYHIAPHSQECIVAAGIRRKIIAADADALDHLQQFIDEKKTWLFGHLNYDLPVQQDMPVSAGSDLINFPQLFFFEPEILIRLNETEMTIEADDPADIFETISSWQTEEGIDRETRLPVQSRMEKEEYLSVIRQLQKHILRGDCYEINFCQEFFAGEAVIDPFRVYQKLTEISPNPFSALYRLNDKWLICASPERFLMKKGNTVLSQPIKGTSKRIPGNAVLDKQSSEQLFHSDKDRSENVMVVDLVRNDLSKICEEGTVQVDELYGIYSFPQVHQMISTVSGTLKRNVSFTEMIRATFPMGSMTGAPKKRVMELIAQYEKTKRGIFSGTVGYISPHGDFDFNVVIRSIMYNATVRYLSFQAGSGITFYSDPEKEWEECMLKAEAIRNVLSA